MKEVAMAMEVENIINNDEISFEERQVNFICEAFRMAIEEGCSNEMVPLVMYIENHKVPSSGLSDIVEIHGIFSVQTVQTAIVRLKSNLKAWSSDVMTQFESSNGKITVVRFIKPKVYPYWAPHKRRLV